MNKEIKDILANRKKEAEEVAKKNLELIFSMPRVKELYQQEIKLKILRAKAKAYNEKFDDTLLKSVTKTIDSILNKINLPREKLLPQYYCKKCCDSGYVDNKECECVKAIKTQLYQQKSNQQKFNDFKDLNLNLLDDIKTKQTFIKLKKFAENYKKQFIFITLLGNTGVGKTFLMECIANELQKQNYFIIFDTFFAINKAFLDFHTSFDKTKIDIDKYLNCDALFIDDLGTEPNFKNVTNEYLFNLINYRIVNKKFTMISSNLSLKEIQNTYGERCFSRLIDKSNNLLIKINNSDIRLKKIKNN